jgi:site-specific DNA-methyltransferase (adenine-specific)
VTPYYSDDLVTIYHGDCREWMPEADLLIADPPYGMALDTDYSGMNGWSGKGRKWDAVVGDEGPFDPSHLLRYRRAVIFGANHFASRLPDSGGWIVWNKRGDGKPSEVAFGDCELAWTNVGQSVRMFSKMWHGVARWSEEPVLHPTQKPVALMLWLIARYSEPGQLVLDPYMGSGPTLIAAKSLGRKAIGIEIEEKYCEIAANRCRQEVLGLVA